MNRKLAYLLAVPFVLTACEHHSSPAESLGLVTPLAPPNESTAPGAGTSSSSSSAETSSSSSASSIPSETGGGNSSEGGQTFDPLLRFEFREGASEHPIEVKGSASINGQRIPGRYVIWKNGDVSGYQTTAMALKVGDQVNVTGGFALPGTETPTVDCPSITLTVQTGGSFQCSLVSFTYTPGLNGCMTACH